MNDPYRYEKKYQPAFKRAFPNPVLFLKNQKKAFSAFTLIFLGVTILGYLTFYYSSYILATTDNYSSSPLVKARNLWLAANSPQTLGIKSENQLVYRNFYLSIPSLKINRALVTTNVVSDKKEAYLPVLEESIAHYKGTSLPGQEGNSFLYGHSVLPQFFNSNDFMTIFSTLHKIKDGDEILISYGDKEFKYLVFSKQVVNPEELDVVDLSGNGDKTLTLMTCTPPGTYLKRLLVTAKLED